jgi:predicted Zn-dependent protease
LEKLGEWTKVQVADLPQLYAQLASYGHGQLNSLGARITLNFMLIQNCKQKLLVRLIHKASAAIVIGAIWVVLPMPVLAQNSATLPLLGDSSDMTSSAERRLGDRIARELYRDPDYLDDPVLGDYVQGIWQPLLAAARARGDLTPELDERFAWQILLGRDRSVNAFALPGGYLGVHLGLLAVVSSRDELASVLGHELSHVTQRHISRLMSKSSQQAPWLMGAMILGVLAASKNADAGNALIMGGQAVSAQSQLNFSRDMEREADRVGLGVMTQAGFDSQGFVTMFAKLQQASRLNDNGAYPYLRSHPLTTERIADMQARLPLATFNAADTSPTVVHAMMAARARVLANAGPDALRSWRQQVSDTAFLTQPRAQQAGVLYGAALAASHLRDVVEAQRLLQQLQLLVAPDALAAKQAAWLGAEISLVARDLSTAQWRALGSTLALDMAPSASASPTRAELVLQAQIALQTGDAPVLDAAAQRLQIWVSLHPLDATLWQGLSSLYAAQGQSLRALRADAETQVARLDYTAALDRIKAAQERMRQMGGASSSADHIDASIIDTRFRQISALIKEQAKEQDKDR